LIPARVRGAGTTVKLGELLQKSEVLAAGAPLDLEVTGLNYDSRTLKPGELFVAVKGLVVDGHRFLPQVQEKGAAGAVVMDTGNLPAGLPWVRVKDTRRELSRLSARFYDYPSRRLKVIGVTGTNGKTTTTFLIEKILTDGGFAAGLLGTISNRVGNRELASSRTTPESLDVQRLLAEMVQAGADYGVMEVSSHALALNRVEDVNFEAAVFTNLTQDHLDFHPTMDDYRRAKVRLFEMLDPDQPALINLDDPNAPYFLKAKRGVALGYGFSPEADFRAENLKTGLKGSCFDLRYPGGRITVQLNTPGKFSVYNALAAFGLTFSQGLDPQGIARSLAHYPGVPGRFQVLPTARPFAVVVDYAHTPDGLDNVLKTIRDFVEGRVITVFGAGGDRDRSKRPLMGERAGSLSDYVLVTSDNPRTEDPLKIIQDILPGLKRTGTPYLAEPDRRVAIAKALRLAGPGDVVLIAGKGHETYQIAGETILPFDDRQVALEELKKMGD